MRKVEEKESNHSVKVRAQILYDDLDHIDSFSEYWMTHHSQPNLSTARLSLVSTTQEMFAAERTKDYARLGELLNAVVPNDWPPEHLDEDFLVHCDRQIEQHGSIALGWLSWHIVTDILGERTLAGFFGFGGPPDLLGTLRVGYSLLPRFFSKGLAQEGVGRLIEYAFAHPSVKRIYGDCFRNNVPSARVLERLGFTPLFADEELLGFELLKAGEAPGMNLAKRLEGVWRFDRAENLEGTAPPEVFGFELAVTSDRLQLFSNGTMIEESIYSLPGTRWPREIDIEHLLAPLAGTKACGLIDGIGTHLAMKFSAAGKPRPTSLDLPILPGEELIVLRRVKN